MYLLPADKPIWSPKQVSDTWRGIPDECTEKQTFPLLWRTLCRAQSLRLLNKTCWCVAWSVFSHTWGGGGTCVCSNCEVISPAAYSAISSLTPSHLGLKTQHLTCCVLASPWDLVKPFLGTCHVTLHTKMLVCWTGSPLFKAMTPQICVELYKWFQMKVIDIRGYGLMKSGFMMLYSFETSVRMY